MSSEGKPVRCRTTAGEAGAGASESAQTGLGVMPNPIELQTGQRFGSWTVLGLSERIEKRRMALSVARGRRVEVALDDVGNKKGR
jgi:hypothetical protein